MPSVRSVLRPTLPTRSPGQVALGMPHSVRNSVRRPPREAPRCSCWRVEIRVDVRTDRVADEAVDAGERARGIGAVQRGERRSALEREGRADLPAAEHPARARRSDRARPAAPTRSCREAVRPVERESPDRCRRSNESCATATSPLERLKMSDAVSRNLLQV